MNKFIISFQGIKGAFSERAAQIFFGNRNIKTKGFETFDDVFQAVKNATTTHACIPIENSSTGSVSSNYYLLKKFDGFVTGEIFLRISHSLLGVKNTSIEKVKTVISHPQALKQCRKFLKKHPWIKPKTEFDTAGAAKIVSAKKDPTLTAIAAEWTGKLYGLQSLENKIETCKENYTRFLIIQKRKTAVENANKISVLYSIRHKPGSLLQSIEPFARQGINLTKIESIPIIGKPWEYYFFADYEVKSREKMETTLKKLKKQCDWMKLFGWYQKGAVYES